MRERKGAAGEETVASRKEKIHRIRTKNTRKKLKIMYTTSLSPPRSVTGADGGFRLGRMAKGIRNSLKELRYSTSPFAPIDVWEYAKISIYIIKNLKKNYCRAVIGAS